MPSTPCRGPTYITFSTTADVRIPVMVATFLRRGMDICLQVEHGFPTVCRLLRRYMHAMQQVRDAHAQHQTLDGSGGGQFTTMQGFQYILTPVYLRITSTNHSPNGLLVVVN